MTVLDHIDEDTARSVSELADLTGQSKRDVQQELEQLMEQGEITSTPDWRYRRSRRQRDE